MASGFTQADESGTTIVRPNPLAMGAMVAGGAMAAAWGAVDAPRASDTGQLFLHLCFVVIGLIYVLAGVRTRVVLRPDTVTIIRAFGTDEIDRRDLHFVRRSGGRGKPPAVVLRAGARPRRRYLGRVAPARPGPGAGFATVPGAFGPTRLARALGVDVRPYSAAGRSARVRQTDNRLDPLPDPGQWDELVRRAEQLSIDTARTVHAERQATIGSSTAGIAAPGVGGYWPVYERRLFTKQWRQICSVDVACQRAADRLRAEAAAFGPEPARSSSGARPPTPAPRANGPLPPG